MIEIQTDRLILRELTVDDVTPRYLSWFNDESAGKYITAAATTRTLDDLRGYVRERSGRDDVVFLAIVDRATGVHVGNIKYEPVDRAAGFAVMGVMIGDRDWRGKGVTREALESSAAWLREHRGISQIILGVSPDNAAAIRAYEKTGFRIERTPHLPKAEGGAITMVWRLA